MAYSAEVVRRARQRLAMAKEDRESENREHLARAYAQVPRIREIDMELRRTMAQAARAAFDQGSDGRDMLAQARDRNLSLQRERARLAAEYFEEGFLDETPICEKCGGSGYIGASMCECLEELCRQEQKKEVSILSGSRDSFSQFRLDFYSDVPDPKLGASPRAIMERNYQTARRYGLTFQQNSGNLLFVGNTGLGKTFLSACIARAVTDRGFSVMYESAGHMFSKLDQARFNSNEETRAEAAKLMLLIGKGEGQTSEGFDQRPDWEANLTIAREVTDDLNAQVDGLCRDVCVKSGRFNQHVAVGCVLVEAGNNRNTLEEVLAAMPYLADAIMKALAL